MRFLNNDIEMHLRFSDCDWVECKREIKVTNNFEYPKKQNKVTKVIIISTFGVEEFVKSFTTLSVLHFSIRRRGTLLAH